MHGRRRRMGDDVAGLGPGQQARDAEGDPLPALARAALFGVHLLHRLQGQFRRVQGHGAGALWRAEVQGPDPGQDRRPQGGRHLPPRPAVLRLLHRSAHDEREVRRAVRRQGAQARGAADPASHGSRGVGAGRHRGDRDPAGALGEEGDRGEEHLPGRRRGAELRRQRQAAAREPVRRHLGAAGGRRCRRRGRRGLRRLPRLSRPGAQAQRPSRRHGRLLSRPGIHRRRDREAPGRGRRQADAADARPDHRADGAGAGRREGGGLDAGPHGVRAALARRPLDPGRCALALDAEDAEPQGQVPRIVPALRAGGAARGRRQVFRHQERQPLHADGGAGERGSPPRHERGRAGAVRHRQAERAALRHPGGDPRRLFGAHPDGAQGNQPGLPRPACRRSRPRPATRWW